MRNNDVLIRQVNALARRRHTGASREWQLSRCHGAAIARVPSLDEAIAMARTLIAGNGGRIYLQRTVGRPQPHAAALTPLHADIASSVEPQAGADDGHGAVPPEGRAQNPVAREDGGVDTVAVSPATPAAVIQ
jgi:hypothetical protein